MFDDERSSWWNTLFPHEQNYIKALLPNMGKVILNPDKASPAMYLYYLTGLFDNKKDSKDYELIEQTLLTTERICNNNIDLHDIYTRIAEFYYKHRERPDNLIRCERYCLLDLDILEEYLQNVFDFFKGRIPPIKTIFRLVVMYEKEHRYQEALKVCELGIDLKLDGYEERKKRIEKKIIPKREMLRE